MSSDFFKKLQPLFEDKAEPAKMSKKARAADTEQSDKEYIAKKKQREADKKEAAKKPANVKETATDFFRKYSTIVTEAESAADREDDDDDTNSDEEDDGLETKKDAKKKNLPPWLKDKKDVKESYGDDDEDPDVAKADKVKGKDGKTQKDAEGKKKWSFDKADKSAEDKGAKKVAKEKVDESVDDDEDPDVKKADAVKGKDGKTQKDAEKGKKFDFSKLDKKDADKGAKKAKADKGLTESVQLNEYLTREGSNFDDILMLNLFTDLCDDEGSISYEFPEWLEDPAWQAVAAKYTPIANQLEQEILAQAKTGRKMTDEEAEAIDNTWYDGSDAYDDVDDGAYFLPQTYDDQIRAIKAVLAGALDGYDPDGEDVEESFAPIAESAPARRWVKNK